MLLKNLMKMGKKNGFFSLFSKFISRLKNCKNISCLTQICSAGKKFIELIKPNLSSFRSRVFLFRLGSFRPILTYLDSSTLI